MIGKNQICRKINLTARRALHLLGSNRYAYLHRNRVIDQEVVDLHGTAYERGFTHGKLFKSIIPQLMEHNLYSHLEKADRSLLETYRERLLAFQSHQLPQVVEEIQGISSGAEVPFWKAFDYNLSSILLLDLFPVAEANCTSIWLRSIDGEYVHGGTLDQGLPDGSQLIKRVFPKNGQPYLGEMIIGTVWSPFGMNAAGLTLGGSSVNSLKTQGICLEGTNALFLTGDILESACSVEEARKLCMSHHTIVPLNAGNNWIIADANGHAMKIEIVAGNYDYVVPDEGLLLSTNHFTSEKMEQWNRHDTTYVEQLHQSSVARYHRLKSHFEDRSKYTFDGLREILRSHEQPGAICRHRGRDGELGQTTISYIMIPRKRMHYWIGNSCEGRPREVAMA